MPRVNTHAVLFHNELNFINDCPPRSFDAENLRSFDDVICGCTFANDTLQSDKSFGVLKYMKLCTYHQ